MSSVTPLRAASPHVGSARDQVVRGCARVQSEILSPASSLSLSLSLIAREGGNGRLTMPRDPHDPGQAPYAAPDKPYPAAFLGWMRWIASRPRVPSPRDRRRSKNRHASSCTCPLGIYSSRRDRAAVANTRAPRERRTARGRGRLICARKHGTKKRKRRSASSERDRPTGTSTHLRRRAKLRLVIATARVSPRDVRPDILIDDLRGGEITR